MNFMKLQKANKKNVLSIKRHANENSCKIERPKKDLNLKRVWNWDKINKKFSSCEQNNKKKLIKFNLRKSKSFCFRSLFI